MAGKGQAEEKVEKYNGYCVKCKEKRDFDGTVAITQGLNEGETVVTEGGILLDNQIEIAH